MLLPCTGAKITLEDSFYKRSEDGGAFDICVELKTDIKRNVDFQLTVFQLTAQGGIDCNGSCLSNVHFNFRPSSDPSDFVPPGVLTGRFVMGGVREICFTFTIIDDGCVEDKESFEVELSTMDNDVDIHISTAVVTIWDNDCECSSSFR